MNERITLALGHEGKHVTFPELETISFVPGQRLNPIRHYEVCEFIREFVDMETPFTLLDESHMITHGGARWAGAFEARTPFDFDWVIACLNANDGTSSLSLHSGIVFREFGHTMSFHESKVLLKKYTHVTHEEVRVLVNENLPVLREHFNLEDERRDSYMRIHLNRVSAHDIICRVIEHDIMAGRLIGELIHLWNNPKGPYKLRNLWSLFMITSWMLNRLKPNEMIERTIKLHHFFDDVAKFNKKPTKWVQERFA